MKKVIIPVLEVAVVTLLMTGFMVLAFFFALQPENWYAGMHDSQHEYQNCKCYERLVANAKKNR